MAQAGAAGRYNQRYRANEHRKNFNQAMLWVTAGVIVVMLFAHIGQLAAISGQAKEIDALKEDIREMEDIQQQLELQLATRQVSSRVTDEAVGRLGMIEPSDDKVRQISLGDYMN